MNTRILNSGLAAIIAAALLAGCGGSSPGGGAAASGEATQASFTGDWKVTGHIVTPWFGGEGFAPEPDAEILEKTLTITDKGSSGPAILTCEDAGFTVKTVPLAEMFGGKITDPALARSALGVTEAQTPTLIEGCSSGGSEVEMSYYLIAKDTLLLALNDTIYQFGHPSAEPEAPTAPAAPAPATPPATTEPPKPQ